MRRYPHFSRFLVPILGAAALLLPATPGQSQRQTLQTRASAPAEAQWLGRLPSSQNLRLSLSLPLRNESQLKVLLKQLNDPTSANYRKFLTVQQFTEQFGPTADDYAKVVSFAKAHGLTVTRTFSNRLVVNVSGSAANVGQAFHVTMQSYQHPTEKRTFFAPDVEPTIDRGLPLLTVDGLTDYMLPKPMLKKASADAVHSDQTGSGQGGQYLGSDMRAAYAPGVTLDGTGQTVGLVELGPYNLSDVQLYFSTVGQPLNVPIYNALLDVDGVCYGTPASGGCDDGEEVIDIEQAISMAPHLAGVIVYEAYGSGSDALTAFTQAATDNVAKQLSLSFGFGGTPSTEPGYEQIFMELAAQGQNLFIASGDSGANVGGVGYPGNSPNVTDAGGTDITTTGPGGVWQSESAWVGSGGGWSNQSPIPAYQVPVINSSNQGSPSYRNIPDVAMEANTDNFFCANGECSGGIGGTSLAAPRWAGFLALANQQANGTPIGFLNTTFYTLGQGSTYDSIFHDITTGNDFNTGSPDLFSAVTGYDLTTGWGSPTGQAMIDALAPVSVSSQGFSIAASPATLPLTPGASATSSITVTPVNGFSGAVALTVSAIGSPTGVTASLSQNSISGAGSAVLSVSTTSATQGGTYVIAVTGTSGGIAHTAYVQIALPDFALTASPNYLYLNQGGFTSSTVTVTPLNGFSGSVALTSSADLPQGVFESVRPTVVRTKGTILLGASNMAATGLGNAVSVTGTSGTTQHTVSSIVLAVNAAVGDCGSGVPVNLGSAYNLHAIYKDGASFTTNGLDGDGYAFSANLLTPSRVLSGVLFKFGTPGALNAVYGTGQTIPLPTGKFTSLQFLATGIQGEQAAQTFTVTYTDGTVATINQSFSDWYSPSNNINESEAVAMPYRDTASGGADDRQFNLYGYTLVLNHAKTVKSVTLPANRNVVILAATLTAQSLGTSVNLAPAFDATGIYTDGTTFPGDGGLDGGGAAYSANLLRDSAGPTSLVVGGLNFDLAAANLPNVVYGSGQSFALTEGHFSKLHILGTGVQGSQTGQTVVVTYTDGTTSKFTQSFSDWFSPQSFPGESKAVSMAYRDYNDGSQDNQTFNLYEYTFQLNPFKTVKSLKLPNNRYVVALAVTLEQETNDSEILRCRDLPQPGPHREP